MDCLPFVGCIYSSLGTGKLLRGRGFISKYYQMQLLLYATHNTSKHNSGRHSGFKTVLDFVFEEVNQTEHDPGEIRYKMYDNFLI